MHFMMAMENIVATLRLWILKLTGQSGGSKIYDIKELNAYFNLTPIDTFM